MAGGSRFHPIIIIGAPRSGTNMLRDVLTQLPGVATWPCDEINYLWRYGNAAHPDDELTPEHAHPRVKQYIGRAFERLAQKTRCRWVVEKTCANSLRVGFVDRIVPNARYIFLIRDGRDAVASAMKRWTARPDLRYVLKKLRFVPPRDLAHYARRHLTQRLGRLMNGKRDLPSWGPRFAGMSEMLSSNDLPQICAAQWARCVLKAKEDLNHLDQNRIIQVRYEDFVRQPDENVKRLLEFLGISATVEQCQDAVWPVSSTSIGNWQSSLKGAVLERLAPLIDPVLADFGYDPILATGQTTPQAA